MTLKYDYEKCSRWQQTTDLQQQIKSLDKLQKIVFVKIEQMQKQRIKWTKISEKRQFF